MLADTQSAEGEGDSSLLKGYQDAVDEAQMAVEQIVIPTQQPIELLPQTPELIDVQVLLLSCTANTLQILLTFYHL